MTLPDAQPMQPNLRYEVKFVGPPTCREVIERWLLSHWAGFHTAYPSRWVNSVYLDDHQLSAMAENLSGVSARTKLRFRWYGDIVAEPSGMLELKVKRARLGWKQHQAVERLPMQGAAWREILAELRETVPDRPRLWLDEYPQPVIINRYLRDYFVSHDGRIRVTVDREQMVFGQLHSPLPNLRAKANLPDALIVEIKADEHDHREVNRVVQGLPLRASRHSKYVTGVLATLGR